MAFWNWRTASLADNALSRVFELSVTRVDPCGAP